jgi:hypothetical protein
MANLLQLENSFAVYLGWYGVLLENDEECVLELYPEIHAVYKIDATGASGYLSGMKEFFQSFTKLETGNAYLVVLKPGVSSIDIPNFEQGDTDKLNIALCDGDGNVNLTLNEDLFDLELSESQYSSHIGWYGAVNNNQCEETEYDFSKNENIVRVFQFANGSLDKSYDVNAPDWSKTFTKLKPGGMYYIVLKPGTGAINIENFVSTSSTKKISSDLVFKVRKKTKVWVFLANSAKKKFSDYEYYLGKTDEHGNQIKSKLLVSDLDDLLNKRNYVYPNQPEFEQKVTGSVSDYFKSLTFEQLDFHFEILNFGYENDINDPDSSAWRITDFSDVSSEIAKWYASAFKNMQERTELQDESFPTRFDETTKKFKNPRSMGVILHTHTEIRDRCLKNDLVDEDGKIRRTSIVAVRDKSNNNRLEPVGTLIHEMIHSFELKDLYTPNEIGKGFGKADPMAFGFWGHTQGSSGKYFPYFPSGYTRYKMTEFNSLKSKIVDIAEPTKDIELFSPLYKNEIVRVRHPNHSDIWYVDYRSPNTDSTINQCVNYDRELIESGLSIVHEYPTFIPDQTSYIPCHQRAESGYTVSLEQQDGLYQLQEGKDFRAIEFDSADNKSDFFKPGDEFSSYTMPSSVSYEGKPTGIKIHNIRNTSVGSILFDLDFISPPTFEFRNTTYSCKIYNVEYYRLNTNSKINEYATRSSSPNDIPGPKPILFDFENSYLRDESIRVKIETRGIPHGVKLAMKYKKRNATEFTIPGDWAISSIDSRRQPRGFVTFDIPARLLPLYLQNNRNHFMFEVLDSDWKVIFPWIDFIDVKNL